MQCHLESLSYSSRHCKNDRFRPHLLRDAIVDAVVVVAVFKRVGT
jgi:hypothetical protein